MGENGGATGPAPVMHDLFGAPASSAHAEDFENVHLYLESVLGPDAFFKLFNQALVEMDARAAGFANQVMVMLAWLDEFVSSLAIAQIDCLHQTKADQRF